VLSACNSAAGEDLSGEGLNGVNHAFLSAGAKKIISTVWDVDDNVSKQLMAKFYRNLLHSGLDSPEALRRSQMEIMHESSTKAPYYWAGFIVTSTAN
jgi:CHAT domain-containing protein